ncbi:MAG TPA: hypothetical protein VJX16_15090 [Terriglobales bacterium]|nr:hypothetical protein [Terriglobales bacterium]
MRNIDEVISEKNSAVQQLRREVEALRLVAPLLAEAGEGPRSISIQPVMVGEGSSERDMNSFQETENFPTKKPAAGSQSLGSEATFAKAREISRHLRRIAAPLFGTSGS